MIKTKQNFRVFADYNQFYLWDKVAAPEAPLDYSDQDVKNKIKVAANIIVVQPERNMEVPVEIQIYDSDPHLPEEIWDHVVDCSLELPSGKLQIHECTGGPVAEFNLRPGTYQVRACFCGLGTLDESGLEGDDYYMIALWPGQPRPLMVVKQWQAE